MGIISQLVMKNFSNIFNNDSLRKNIINSLFYFGGSFLQLLVAIFTQPIYARYLSLRDFAIIGYFSAIQALLVSAFSFNMTYYYISKYWVREEENNSPIENLSFILNYLNITNIIIALISFIIIGLYFNVFQVSFPLLPFLLIIIINLYFEKFITYYLIECRVNKKGLQYFLIRLLQLFLNTFFSLYFVIYFNGGAVGRMSGILLGVIITSLIALIIFIKQKKFKPSLKINKTKIKSALKYCFPLIIGSYSYFPINNIDRIFLERLNNTEEYGYYSIGLTISGFLSIFFIAIYQSFEPDLYKFIAQKKIKQYLQFASFYIVLVAVICISFIFLSKSVVSILTDGRYTYASLYANYFVIGIFFMQIGGFFEQLFTAYGATKYVMWRNIIIGIFSIVIYYFLINKYQFFGANITRIIIPLLYILIGAVLFYFYFKKKLPR